MALPGWVGKQLDRLADLQLRQSAPIPIDLGAVPDSPWTAPGWKEVDITYTCVPDSVYPWDPKVLERIHEFDPEAVPIWVRWTFRSPDNKQLVTFGRHAIGRYRPILTKDVPHLSIEAMPSVPKMKRPNVIEFIWMDNNEDDDLPGKYRPFDDRLVFFCRKNYAQKSVREYMAQIESWREAYFKNVASMKEDMAYRQKDLDRYVQKKLDQMSEVEMGEVFGNLQHRKKEIKPMVVLRSTRGE